MMPINEMTFRVKKTDADTTVHGSLHFQQVKRLTAFSVESCHIDLVEETKEQMRHRLWRETYGELISPMEELGIIARQACASHEEGRVLELVQKLRLMLHRPIVNLPCEQKPVG